MKLQAKNQRFAVRKLRTNSQAGGMLPKKAVPGAGFNKHRIRNWKFPPLVYPKQEELSDYDYEAVKVATRFKHQKMVRDYFREFFSG